MKRMLLSFCYYIAVIAGVMSVFVLINSGTSFLPDEGRLPADVSQRIYGVPRPEKGDDGMYRFTLLCDKLPDDDLVLVCTGLEPFTLYANESVLFSYDSANTFQRTHMVTLSPELWQDGKLNLALQIQRIDKGKLSIGGEKVVLHSAQNMYALNFFCIGLACVLMLYSLTLFVSKRSERYLLLLVLVTTIVIIKALFTSVFPLIPLSHRTHALLQYPLDSLAKVLITVLCMRMLQIKLPHRLEWITELPGIVLFTGLMLVLQYTPIQIKSIVLNVLYAGVGLLISFAYSHNQPYARVLLTGCAARYGMYYYFRLANLSLIPAGMPILFLHTTQVAHLLFLVCCIFSINNRFAAKFCEAEKLAAELGIINAEMDKRIAERTRELEQANALILNQQEQQHSMMLNIFHDLRSPLFAVQGCAQIAQGKTREDEEYLDVIRNRLGFLGKLTEDIFLAAKLEEGGITYVSDSVDLCRLCTTVAEGFVPESKKKGIALSILLPKEPVVIEADGFRLKQMLENLLSNAVKYSNPGGYVQLSLVPEKTCAKIEVKDNGIGIPSEKLPHVFERFYRAAQKEDSSGLGLYIANMIAQAHKGSIKAAPNEPQGTTFTVCLPYAVDDEDSRDHGIQSL